LNLIDLENSGLGTLELQECGKLADATEPPGLSSREGGSASPKGCLVPSGICARLGWSRQKSL